MNSKSMKSHDIFITMKIKSTLSNSGHIGWQKVSKHLKTLKHLDFIMIDVPSLSTADQRKLFLVLR